MSRGGNWGDTTITTWQLGNQKYVHGDPVLSVLTFSDTLVRREEKEDRLSPIFPTHPQPSIDDRHDWWWDDGDWCRVLAPSFQKVIFFSPYDKKNDLMEEGQRLKV